MTDEIPVAEMPTMIQEEYIDEHTYADDPSNAHPIDDDILIDVCDTKMGPILIEYDLALIQAIAVREILPYNCETEIWIEQCDGMHYYQAQSVTFYDLLSMAYQRYDHARVEIEDAADLAEAHTRQYLRDVHGYEGDFGGQVPNDSIDKVREPTLCSAQNDAHWLRDEEPEDAHYAFTDARGLVIEEGTHEMEDQ
jgi:hypothetical protein